MAIFDIENLLRNGSIGDVLEVRFALNKDSKGFHEFIANSSDLLSASSIREACESTFTYEGRVVNKLHLDGRDFEIKFEAGKRLGRTYFQEGASSKDYYYFFNDAHVIKSIRTA